MLDYSADNIVDKYSKSIEHKYNTFYAHLKRHEFKTAIQTLHTLSHVNFFKKCDFWMPLKPLSWCHVNRQHLQKSVLNIMCNKCMSM